MEEKIWKLILISGQPNTEQKMRDLFDQIRRDRHFFVIQFRALRNFLDFPERQPIHPKQLLEEIKETVKEHMEKRYPPHYSYLFRSCFSMQYVLL